jgi:heat-inducible transcriptional repressor
MVNDAPEDVLNERAQQLLRALIESYIRDGQPVGSRVLSRDSGLQLSSATIRNVMADLEEWGFVTSPHTSAGRIPTDKGYRFFVDHLTQPGVLGPTQHKQVCSFFDQVHGEMEDMLERATGLLSELTSYAAVVVGPSHDTATIRSVQVVGLAPRVALLVVVLSDGAVEKRTIELEVDITDDVLHAAGALLTSQLVGRTTSASWSVPSSGNGDVDRVVAAAGTAFGLIERSMESDQVFVGGPSRLAQSFDAVETVRSVLGILEQQLVVVTLLRDVLNRGLSVAIGTEHGYEPLASCAVVVAPVSIDGYELGAVGLFGPTRMDYPRALAAAHVVGERLGERLGESGRGGAPAGTGSHDGGH